MFRIRGKRISLVLAAATAVLLCITGCGAISSPLDVVETVEIGRYTGRWYEIARYPNWFEQGCAGVTADYALRTDGRISVLNTCREGGLEGQVRTAQGVARVVDPRTNAKFKVSFFGPFEGDYWIIELGEDYEYAVVGEPGRNYLWILSRTPMLDSDLYDDILSRLPDQGYDPARLIKTDQGL